MEWIAERLIAQAIRMRPETSSWEWSIKIIDDPETVNACAMAGGKMALYTGLVEQVKPTDDELAQVLGHEISHALAKHSAEKMSMAMMTRLGVIAVGAASDRPALTMAGAGTGRPSWRWSCPTVAPPRARRIASASSWRQRRAMIPVPPSPSGKRWRRWAATTRRSFSVPTLHRRVGSRP